MIQMMNETKRKNDSDLYKKYIKNISYIYRTIHTMSETQVLETMSAEDQKKYLKKISNKKYYESKKAIINEKYKDQKREYFNNRYKNDAEFRLKQIKTSNERYEEFHKYKSFYEANKLVATV